MWQIIDTIQAFYDNRFILNLLNCIIFQICAKTKKITRKINGYALILLNVCIANISAYFVSIIIDKIIYTTNSILAKVVSKAPH